MVAKEKATTRTNAQQRIHISKVKAKVGTAEKAAAAKDGAAAARDGEAKEAKAREKVKAAREAKEAFTNWTSWDNGDHTTNRTGDRKLAGNLHGTTFHTYDLSGASTLSSRPRPHVPTLRSPHVDVGHMFCQIGSPLRQ